MTEYDSKEDYYEAKSCLIYIIAAILVIVVLKYIL